MSVRPGFWPSQLSAAQAAAQLRREPPQFGGTALYWAESRPAEGGRTTIVCWDGTQTRDCLPAPYSVRSRVNAYGGGAWTVAADGRLWFVNAEDQGLYCRLPQGRIVPWLVSRRRSFADLTLLLDGRIAAVCEEHDQCQYLAAIDARGEMTRLHAGFDFYASPRQSPDGGGLAWICWNAPQMPWDNTELWRAEFGRAPWLHHPRRVLDGASLQQPLWHPDGRLHLLSDASGWWRPHTETGCLHGGRADCAHPPWVFGRPTHAFNDQGDLFYAARRRRGWSLYRVPAGSDKAEFIEAPFREIEGLAVSGRRLAVLGGGPGHELGIAIRDGQDWHWLSGGEPDPGEPVSSPRRLRSGHEVESFYYPPQNQARQLGRGQRPPMIVKVHGGPTAAASTALDLRTQFWTSRGFAVLWVDYRGSTGYGRAYRDQLYGGWGRHDVDDCRDAARAAVARGWADPKALFVSGSSAGGLTALNLLVRCRDFRAATSYAGVADLAGLLQHDHRFEAGYTRRLVSRGRDLVRRCRARSPLHQVSKMQAPVLFVQGGRDDVVPPSQSRKMYEALVFRGLPARILEFPDEAHGLRDQEAIASALEAELAFYQSLMDDPDAD